MRYVALETPELHIERVLQRAARAGHSASGKRRYGELTLTVSETCNRSRSKRKRYRVGARLR